MCMDKVIQDPVDQLKAEFHFGRNGTPLCYVTGVRVKPTKRSCTQFDSNSWSGHSFKRRNLTIHAEGFDVSIGKHGVFEQVYPVGTE
ncbi:hypothetical protein TWF106_000458 [Orbilia oligospora]|uniref:Uncharacterized protein n=1 Tax=Orbilia oligospora TaxID=2813651 RepID=A0A7C8UGJ2_ORBOL|nr:hypothetical protein TWF106_000458 [Orbilia oligospora]